MLLKFQEHAIFFFLYLCLLDFIKQNIVYAKIRNGVVIDLY